jgi:hypothetical protein
MSVSQDNEMQNGHAVSMLPDNAVIDINRTSLINADYTKKIIGTTVILLCLFSGGPLTAVSVISVALALGAQFIDDLYDAASQLSFSVGNLVIPQIDAALKRMAIEKADAKMQAHFTECQIIMEQFDKWKKAGDKVDRENAAINLRYDYSRITGTYLPDLIGDFTEDTYRGIVLPQFVQSMSSYLMVILCYYHHGAALGIAPRRSFSTLKDQILVQFRSDLQKMTDIAITSYRRGLEKLLTVEQNYPRSWHDYNDYRNTVTRTGLDLLASLVFLDPEQYPQGCAPRCWNRHLFKLLDTSTDKFKSALIKDIKGMDERILHNEPVAHLIRVDMTGGRFMHATSPSRHRIDGLYRMHTHLLAIDGDGIEEYPFPPTGGESGGATVTNPLLKEHIFSEGKCDKVVGRYWNGTKTEIVNIPPVGNTLEHYTQCITELQFWNKNISSEVYSFTSPQSIQDKEATNEFSIEFQPLELELPSSKWPVIDRVEELADIKVIDERDANLIHYAFVMANHRTRALLTPAVKHAYAQRAAPVEQYHAIRALPQIHGEQLKIIPGPGFTGGDLVECKPQSSISFTMRKISDLDPWFNGGYRVRLWVVNDSLEEVPVIVSVKSFVLNRDGPQSAAGLRITVPPSRPDRNKLNYTDLMYIEFPLPKILLLVAWVDKIELTFRNQSRTGSIILDRIELQFYALMS